ncbi:MAG: hypothetical protein H6818_17255 [Phycisphaerales bacterium]|nr:hypothetical protein [Phycisphaerales bacterium]
MSKVQSYLNRQGVRYYLPEFGPPARWIASIWQADASDAAPTLHYYECDAENLCCRSIDVSPDGRITLAFPGGPGGDLLPEGPIPPLEEMNAFTETSSREITGDEFRALWAAFARTVGDDAAS